MSNVLMPDHELTELSKLQRQVERERSARLEAERIAELNMRELHQRQRQLELLEAVAGKANQSSDLTEVLQFSIQKICQFTDWALGHAYVADSGSQEHLQSTLIWSKNIASSPAIDQFIQSTEARGFDRGVGLPGRVMETGAAAWAVDIVNDPNFPKSDLTQDAGLKAAYAFPVLAGGKVAAVLEFFSTHAQEPEQVLQRIMIQLCVQLGRVIERSSAEKRLVHDSMHDRLTGLPNRILFLDRLQNAIAHQKRNAKKHHVAVLFVDLDRFKVVNDSLGHLVGDKLLTLVAHRIQSIVRTEDTVARFAYFRDKDTLARLGSDEFVVLLDDIRSPDDALRVAERIQRTLVTFPFNLDGQDVYVTASIGLATTADAQTGAEDLLRNASLAMYRAKTLGGSCSESFDQSMQIRAMNRLIVESDMRRGLTENKFILHYQPIVSLKTGVIMGFEALVRWQRTEDKLVYPNDFIYIAEETGFILSLDMWVLKEACSTMLQWQRDFPREQPLTMSVNLSARLFAQADLAGQIRAIIHASGISPSSIRLEITESMIMGDAERSVKILTELKELGVHLSIDDFGTGYSSLSYLHRFPADTLKIDRSFVSRMDDSPECSPIIQSIMSLANNLKMDVIAEGPETAAHVQHLQGLDCDYGQGYFFSRPVDASQVEQLLSSSFVYAV
ncbi:MAG: EAL domain-containing protein [Gammaproteobacteria bacterium]|nr:EAL domain-containing protein [Gammaproteobacteria bacterium]